MSCGLTFSQGVRALVEGLQCNLGLLVLDLEYKSIAAGDSLSTLLETHRTLAVRHKAE